jgi:hypothetical protein
VRPATLLGAAAGGEVEDEDGEEGRGRRCAGAAYKGRGRRREVERTLRRRGRRKIAFASLAAFPSRLSVSLLAVLLNTKYMMPLTCLHMRRIACRLWIGPSIGRRNLRDNTGRPFS